MDSSNRLLSLDVLRGVAVLLVLGRHLPSGQQSAGGGVGRACLALWQQGGWIGVDLFFVLSGFLVSGLLFREYQRSGGLGIGRFLVRRGFKIYPAFYLLLGCTVASVLLARTRTPPWTAILCEACFVQNYGPALWDHTWSLAVEEHFYLLLPLFLMFLKWRAGASSDPFRPILSVFAVIAVVTLLWRLEHAWRVPYSHKSHLFPTHLRLDGLSCGAAISYVYHFHRDRLFTWIRGRTHWLTLLALFLLVPPFAFRLEDSYFLPTAGLTCLYAAGGLLICAWLVRPLGSTLFVRLLAWVGFYSYSIYLWHLFLLRVLSTKWAVSPSGGAASWRFCLCYLVGSVLLGVLMAKLIELPFLALRDRWFPSRASSWEPSRPASSPPLSSAAETS